MTSSSSVLELVVANRCFKAVALELKHLETFVSLCFDEGVGMAIRHANVLYFVGKNGLDCDVGEKGLKKHIDRSLQSKSSYTLSYSEPGDLLQRFEGVQGKPIVIAESSLLQSWLERTKAEFIHPYNEMVVAAG